ncbi:MAG TPA: MFS transporter [Thermomicrobiales bacterium]|jgi:FSR family fosmidomycin resistance protein-like MFS transporter|nr:MFS transporter [Thermomicrobiales bacterium]
MSAARTTDEKRAASTSPEAEGEVQGVGAADDYDRKGVYTLAGAHAAHDLYGGFLGPLLPEIQAKLNVSLTVISLMFPAQQVPGILQPFIGAYVDRRSRKMFVVLGPALTALSISALGLATHVWMVLVLLFISGISSGVFHAPAVALMGEYGGRRSGKAMSIFMSGAEVARALAPLLITAAIAVLTLEGSAAVVVFGLAASVILYFTVDTSASDAARHAAPPVSLRPILSARRTWLGALLAITILNSIATAPYHYFLVKFLVDQGYGEWYAGTAQTIFYSAGVAGMLGGGVFSDRVGSRNTLAISMAAASPLVILYLLIENGGWLPFLALIPASAALTAVRPQIMAISQDLMPEARGAMAGGMLAMSFVSLSITAFAFGAIADRVGLDTAFLGVAAASALAVPFVLILPKRQPAHA